MVFTKNLANEGKIQAVCSCHDLRHAFGCRIYKKTPDIYAIGPTLGHGSVL